MWRWPTIEDWKRQSRSFEDLAVRSQADMSLTGAGDAAHVRGGADFGELLQRAADHCAAGPRL